MSTHTCATWSTTSCRTGAGGSHRESDGRRRYAHRRRARGLGGRRRADEGHGRRQNEVTDLGTFGWFIGVWLTMTVAMMLPSAAPTALLFSRFGRGAQTGVFVAGYLLAWTAFEAAAYVVSRIGREVAPSFLAWDERGPWVAGAALGVAGLYQLTPLKTACLRHCRSPLHYLLHRRPGSLGVVCRRARETECYCVGCCAGLMLALFVARHHERVLDGRRRASAILVEKTLARGETFARLLAVALVALGALDRDRAGQRARGSPARTGCIDADGDAAVSWRISGSYFESCNCDAICPCRRIDGEAGRTLDARDLHRGPLLGDRGRLRRRHRPRAGSPSRWAMPLRRRRARLTVVVDPLPRRPRGQTTQRAVLEAIFSGQLGGDALRHFPWALEGERAARRSLGRRSRSITPRAVSGSASRSRRACGSATATPAARP